VWGAAVNALRELLVVQANAAGDILCDTLCAGVRQPQDAYGLEKLASEEICMHYEKDFGIAVRIARFHNIYGECVHSLR
jgi:nucleoside-diphosphate-sugar epimerase